MRKVSRMLGLLLRFYRENKVLRRKVELLEAKVMVDELTGTYNRAFFCKELELRLKDQARNGSNLTVAFIDLDHFKSINDTYGHDVGDEVLKQVAGHLKGLIRGYDVLSRFGGEEFVLVLPGAALNDAYVKLEAIRESVAEKRFIAADRNRSVTLSIGLAECREGDTHTSICKLADKALYNAKKMGRNRIFIFRRDA